MTVAARVALLLATAALAGGGSLHAQLPADARWQTIESTHFRVTYHAGLEDLARHAAVSAERAHAALAILVADRPASPIDIVVSDNVDLTNGYATPLPSNRIVVFAKPPTTVLELQYVQDWIDLVVTHELAHIFHMDVSGSVGRFVRQIFGRVPLPWPVFTALGTPLWSIEGLAVAIESTVAGHGRVHGSFHEMVVRTAVLEDEIDSIDRLSSAAPVWPGQSRVYIYGSLFFDYLMRRYGADVAVHLVRATAGAIIPAPLWFGGVARPVLGVSFRDAYDEWRSEMELRFHALAAELEQHGLTATEPITHHGAYALYPRFSPDGRFIAYAASDWRSPPRTRIIDVASGTEAWSRRRNDVGPAAWLPDGSLLTAWIDHVDSFRIYSDIHVTSERGDRRVTRGARLQDVDAAGHGRAVAVENSNGTNRLVLLDPATGDRRAITGFDPAVNWSLPRFDPTGSRIAAGRWRLGGTYDIVVLDTLGRSLQTVAAGGISAGPAWSPDGRWLVFWSDRTGIPNLFAAPVDGSGLHQVTNVATGAFFPDVAPDGRTIIFSAYHHDGFSVERIPFDPGAWRAPLAEEIAALQQVRGTYLQLDRTEEVMQSVNSAVLQADTSVGETGAYRALRHMRPYFWLPYVTAGDTQDTFFGIWTMGRDLVDRHAWELLFGIAPSSGRTQGRLSYSFRGLPALRPLSLHPSLSFTLARDWDVYLAGAAAGLPYIDEREDLAAATLALARIRWRSTSGINITGERVRRSRHLFNGGDTLRLRDPVDDLLGGRAVAFFSNAVLPPFAISRENGVTLQIATRRRWDRDVLSTEVNGSEITLDASYSEVTTWNAAYLAMPLPGFSRHVLAARASGLYRSGPGAGLSNIGGASSAGFSVPGVATSLGGSSTLLPVRGFVSGARHGNTAWTASAEYRFPIALVSTSLRPLPLYLDRLAGGLFVDAGHAWCSRTTAERLPDAFCPFTSSAAAPLVGAGLESVAFLSAFGVPVPLRLSFGFPVSGGTTSSPRFEIAAGQSF
jgi:hypothetical protein